MNGNLRTDPGACSPALERLMGQVRGDRDLELVVQRVEQIERLLEGLAKLKVAQTAAQRAAAGQKIAANRRKLQGPAS